MNELLEDLVLFTKALGFVKPPLILKKLITLVCKVEVTETWSRYAQSIKNKKTIKHTQREMTIPLVELQELLDSAINEIISSDGDDDKYEIEFYYEWLCLIQKMSQMEALGK